MSLSARLFGDRQTDYHSVLPAQEAAARLDALVDPDAGRLSAFQRARRSRHARAAGNEVVLQLDHGGFRNDFAPVFRGRFRDDGQGGSLLCGRYCARWPLKAWLVGVTCMATSAAVGSLLAGYGLPWLTLPALAFVVASRLVLSHTLRPDASAVREIEGVINEALDASAPASPLDLLDQEHPQGFNSTNGTKPP